MDEALVNKHLNRSGIIVSGHYFIYDTNIDDKDIICQINLIVELHKSLIGCKFNGLSRIKSTIGKEVESYKVQVKKLHKNYDDLVSQSSMNEIDKLILANGIIMLKKAKEALNYIYKNDYYGVINRSMNREEICIHKVDRNNLRKNNGEVEIGTIKGMTYNLVEEDLYNYIKKLQRKQINVDEEALIKLFVHGSHLSFNSFEYLRGLCSYPKDFLRIWEKYKDNKKEKANEEVLIGLKKSLKYENKNFIK